MKLIVRSSLNENPGTEVVEVSALEKASVNEDITDFTLFLASLVKR